MCRLNAFMREFEAAHIFLCLLRQCSCRCLQWCFPVYPELVIRIQSVYLLYIKRIFVGFLAGIAGYVRKNPTKECNRKQKDG
mgnify:CR=1 FL=1